ncbi:hypothetical protein [Providencia sp. PROV205]|uniref:hypothetical protein n=1 Tax=Providencia sp. PROV205 TaxID=2949903 RepID=UPI00234950DC|nr:hypothetical protein [Providencia sp. PROV205]
MCKEKHPLEKLASAVSNEINKDSEGSVYNNELYLSLNNKHQLKGEIVHDITHAIHDGNLGIEMVEDVLRDILRDIDWVRMKLHNEIPF